MPEVTLPFAGATPAMHYRARTYFAEIGRFGQKDPAERDDRCYKYVRNAPTGATDPMGLWAVDRDPKRSRAKATPDSAGDTIQALADEIGLEPGQFVDWLSLSDPPRKGITVKTKAGGAKDLTTLTLSDQIEEPVWVPNTIIAYWGGDVGVLGRTWVNWNTHIWALERKGFHVAEHKFERNWDLEAQVDSYGRDHVKLVKHAKGSQPNELQELLSTSGTEKSLYGLYLWSHGGGGAVACQDKKEHEGGVAAAEWVTVLEFKTANLPYKMGWGRIYACYSAQGDSDLKASNAKPENWKSFSKILIPILPDWQE